ncbi:methionine adenosyltransferase domain-containing protein [Ruminococcus sp. HUN007]|uniref:methionine adenosyltransferase domain-containing protein n=1 Tax=Ruminococcus sp. HUN007 TaxID=1514668 RepID=UPI0005D259B6|nr:methionine adenosyltransferase domain-containing protein [Ruminococcus sp. HUN007]
MNIVATGLAKRAEIQLAYAIGVAAPVSVYVNTFGTGVVTDEEIQAAVTEIFDFTPGGIIRALDLRKPVFAATSAYGHFGRPDADFTWERTDKAEALKKAVRKVTKYAG